MKPLESMGKFATVVIDPPWDIAIPGYTDHKFAPQLAYSAMSVADITAMPVDKVLDNDSLLYCWTTSRFLPAALGL